MASTEQLQVSIDRGVAQRAFMEGFEEGTESGYRLAGGDAVIRVLAERLALAGLLEAWSRSQWQSASTTTWARDAVAVLERVHAAISGEDVDEHPDANVLAAVVAERARQDAKWGTPTDHPDGTGPDAQPLFAATATGIADDDEASLIRDMMQGRTDCRFSGEGDQPGTWTDILLEEVFEALAEDDPVKLRAELVQVAAVAVKWVRVIDERSAASAPAEGTGQPTNHANRSKDA